MTKPVLGVSVTFMTKAIATLTELHGAKSCEPTSTLNEIVAALAEAEQAYQRLRAVEPKASIGFHRSAE